MKVVIPQIAWHARDPVLTIDFDPRGKTEEGYYRLVTGGADKLLLIWRLTNPDTIKPEIICVAELTRHQKGINVCRFSPCGTYIAAGDDDSYVYIWKNESISEREEVWTVEKILRRHVEDVSDLNWSSDSNYLVSGSVDNTAVLWDVKKGTPLHFWSEREHTGFVQGVAYDPCGEFCATMCIDRHLRFFNNKTGKLLHKTLKYPPAWLGTDEEQTKEKENKPEIPDTVTEKMDVDIDRKPLCEEFLMESETSEEKEKPLSQNSGEGLEKLPVKKPVMTTLNRLFHDDSLKTFCRRLSFSPRGEFLIVPGGLLPPIEKKKEESKVATSPTKEEDDDNSKDKTLKKLDPDQNNAVVIFCRNSFTNPCSIIPTGASYSIAARFSPVYYQRERDEHEYDPSLANSTKKCDRIMSCVGKLRKADSCNEKGILLDMPYRLVYAVATNDSILIGDTASNKPLACVKNIHCTRMTDISWSADGRILLASSTDGYCSIISFDENEFGKKFVAGEEFPPLTPTCFPIAPPEPKPVKKKEPKESKDKEMKEKEIKEKMPMPQTPTENKEEKKKENMIKKMFDASAAKGSPVSRVQAVLQKSSPAQSSSPSLSSPIALAESESIISTPPSAAAVAPKRTLLDNWVKKTPVSSEKKQPRRVTLTPLTSSTNADASQPSRTPSQTLATPSSTISTSTLSTSDKASMSSPSSSLEKMQPRRITLTTLTPKSSSLQIESTSTNSSSLNPIGQTVTSSPSSLQKMQPRRIQLTTLSPSVKIDADQLTESLKPALSQTNNSNGGGMTGSGSVLASNNSSLLLSPQATGTVLKPRRIQPISLSAATNQSDRDTNEPPTKKIGIEETDSSNQKAVTECVTGNDPQKKNSPINTVASSPKVSIAHSNSDSTTK